MTHTNPAVDDPATAEAIVAALRAQKGLSAKGLVLLARHRTTRSERLDRLSEALVTSGICVVRVNSPAFLVDQLQEAFGRTPTITAGLDLTSLLEEIGTSAAGAGIAYAIVISEWHCMKADQLGALIAALHRVAQQRLPVVLFGAGSPRLRRAIGNAKPYAERMFDLIDLDAQQFEGRRPSVSSQG